MKRVSNINSPEINNWQIEKIRWAKLLLDHVSAIRSSRGEQRRKEIIRLENEIMLQIDPENYEEQIDMNILEANRDFIEKLERNFPSLSNTDLLIAGYLRMDFEKSVIAGLKGIDKKSVSMARYRLKKKLGLKSGNNLDSFLHKY